ncbi:hypothetical protein LJD48_28585, partial [Escherichia coli]|uniref:hypothetical protein n=1 Tax=Escherichia coli TaxID=562 RepID=UPI001D0BAC02
MARFVSLLRSFAHVFSEMHIDVDVSEWAYQPAPHILLQKPKIDESPRILVNAPHIPAQAAGQLAHADSTCA